MEGGESVGCSPVAGGAAGDRGAASSAPTPGRAKTRHHVCNLHRGGVKELPPSADVDRGAALGVGLGPAEDLARDGGDVALAEEGEAGQIAERVALDPAEVAAAGEGIFRQA